MKNVTSKIKSIHTNTDGVDIEQKCLGLHVSLNELTPLHNNRGLHIQIRHNGDEATYEAASEIAKLIAFSVNEILKIKQNS